MDENVSKLEARRNNMVDEQLIPRRITNSRVLEVFRKVPRHDFIPDFMEETAYADSPLPIGHGQTISQPYIVALMTEALDLKGAEKVLEVGTGSGYQTAILAELCEKVCTIERNKDLIDNAKKVLKKEQYNNISFREGDGTGGWEEEAPFDSIIVTAAAPHVPRAFKEQLAEGGRLVIPVGTMFSQALMLIKKEKDLFTEENICGCVFVPLVGADGWKEE